MKKTTGEEYMRYLDDPLAWPEGAYMDDTVILVNGQDEDAPGVYPPKPTDRISIDGGFYYSGDGCEGKSLEAHFAKWKRNQSVANLSVVVDKSKIDAVMAAIKEIDGVKKVQA